MTGVSWTPEEDEMLKNLVEEHGTKKWAHIATKIKTKGSKQCRRRWKNFLNMNAKNCSWSPEEDEQLIEAHRRFGNRWTEISKVFGDRTDNAVKNRWAALVRKHPELADDEREGGHSLGGGQDGPSAAKRQRVGESTGAFQPYTSSQGAAPFASSHGGSHFAPMLGHFNGLPVTSMPTPFDQQMVLNPQQQAQQAQQVQHMLAAAAAQQQAVAQAPLSIVVNKELLNPWEMTLVQQINQAHAPVHIEVADRPHPGTDVNAELVTKRSSWRQFVDSLDEPQNPTMQNQMSDILAWFNNQSAGAAQLQGAAGRRLTRRLSKVAALGADSLTDDHRNLLVRLMSKGLEYRTTSEQAELDLLGALEGGGGAGTISTDMAAAAAAAGGAGAGSGTGGKGPLPPRADPMRRTRSSRKSQEFELLHPPLGGGAGAAGAGAGAGGQQQQQSADALLNSGFPGFPSNTSLAGGLITRRTSARREQQQQGQQQQGQQHQQQAQQAAPLTNPQASLGDIFGDVLLTPTFTSQEIAMLIDALTPGAGKGH